MTDRIILGHVSGVHGIKGDVVVRTYTAFPEDIDAYGALGDDTGKRQFVIDTLRVTPKGVIVRFEGVNDRTTAEGLKGMALTVQRDALPEPEDDEFYHADLIGMTAVAPDGTELGRVVAVQNFGAGDLLELKLHGAKQTEYVPFTDPFVPTIDLKARRLTVIMPVLVGDPEPAEGSAEPTEKE